MNQNRFLGEISIPQLLLKFSLPCVTGLLIGAFYNIVDQIFIGNSQLGYLGNAATGISFPVICLVNAFAWCIGDGGAAYLSICSGRQDSESAHRCVGTGITATVIVSVLLSAVSLIFSRPLMRLFGASRQTLDLACDYFEMIALFFTPYILSNVLNSMIRADGSPTYAMLAMTSGAIVNIILDPIFIFLLNWGIRGAAAATVVGQVISFFACLVYFRRPKSFCLRKDSFRLDPAMLKHLIALGGSTFVIQVSMVIMTLVMNITLAKYGALSIYGSDIPMSVFSIQNKVYTIVSNIAVGIALGGQPILGYNYGAGRMDRVRQTYRWIVISSVGIGMGATLIFVLCPEVIISIFGKQNDLYMQFAVKSFRVFLSLSFITCFVKISSIFFQSIGKSVPAMISSLVRDMVCFVSFTLILCWIFEREAPGKGIYGILFASPLADFTAGMVITLMTISFFRKLEKTDTL